MHLRRPRLLSRAELALVRKVNLHPVLDLLLVLGTDGREGESWFDVGGAAEEWPDGYLVRGAAVDGPVDGRGRLEWARGERGGGGCCTLLGGEGLVVLLLLVVKCEAWVRCAWWVGVGVGWEG